MAAPRRLAPILLVAALAPVALAYSNDFSIYPQGAQSCLYDAADASKCTGDSAAVMNNCLCGNGGNFVLLAAACIGEEDSDNLGKVYAVMADACGYSDTPLSVSQKDFLAAGDGTLSSTVSSSATATSTSSTSSTLSTLSTQASSTFSTTTTSAAASTTTGSSAVTASTPTGSSSADSSSGGSGVSKTATIGIIAGATVAGLAILAALIFYAIRVRRYKQASDENHPMLGPQGGPGRGTELSPYIGVGGDTYDYKAPDGHGAHIDTKWPHSPGSFAVTPALSQTSQFGSPHASQTSQFATPMTMQGQFPAPAYAPGAAPAVFELPDERPVPVPAELSSTPLYPPGQGGQPWEQRPYR